MRKWVGLGLFLIGLIVLAYPKIEEGRTETRQQELIRVFEEIGTMEVDATSISTESIEEQTDVRGVIVIPKIELEMPILNSASQASLQNGAGIIESEKEFGINNVGVAGHRGATYGKQFNRLNELTQNDVIEVKTKTMTYEFVVVDSFIVDQREVDVLDDQDEAILTLVTCTPIGAKNPTDRLIVQAKLKDKE